MPPEGPDKSLELQMQIRRNAMEMQEVFSDLFEWEKDIAKKDEALRKQSTASSGSGAAPAPRGKAAGPTGPVDASLQQLPAAFRVPGAGGTQPPAPGTKVRRKKAKAKPAPLPASHTYENYRDRWDKFDVDAALAESDESEYEWVEVEAENASGTASDGPADASTGGASTAPADMREVSTTRVAGPGAEVAGTSGGAQTSAPSGPAVRGQPKTADEWRARGNDLFRAGQFEDAATCYGRSIDVEPTPQAYGNRALALLKLRRWADAARDAEAAVALDPAFVKGHQRAAVAKLELGDLAGAVQDFESALRLEPTSQALRQDRLSALSKLLAKERLERPETYIRVPVTFRSAREGGAAAAASAAPAIVSERAAPGEDRTDDAASRAGLQDGQAGAVGLALHTAGTSGAGQAQPLQTATGDEGSPSAADARPGTADARGGSQHAPLAAPMLQARAAAAAVAREREGGAPWVPASGTELETRWRSAQSAAARADILAALPCQNLPALLRSSLTPAFLRDALTVAATEMRAARGEGPALELLRALVKVPRFDITCMLLPRADRGAVAGAFERWEAESGEPGAVRELRKTMKL